MDTDSFMVELDKLFQEAYENWLRDRPVIWNALDIETLCERYIKWERTHSKEEKLDGSD